jgi:Holliday junction resolvase RusA-like endonuclease
MTSPRRSGSRRDPPVVPADAWRVACERRAGVPLVLEVRVRTMSADISGGISTADVALPERSSILVIRAFGTPAPQGSKSFKGMRGGKPILAESSKKVTPWRAAVVDAALQAVKVAGWVTLGKDVPVRLEVEFFLKPPATMPKGRTAPTTYPDVSKLIRSTEDALTSAKVWADDAQVVRLVTGKFYAEPGQPCGARIRVSAMSDQGAFA